LISRSDGTYVFVNCDGAPKKLPVPPDQLPVDTPETVPIKKQVGDVLQRTELGPAFAAIEVVKIPTVTVDVIGGHPV
jgi:hypothetical protein